MVKLLRPGGWGVFTGAFPPYCPVDEGSCVLKCSVKKPSLMDQDYGGLPVVWLKRNVRWCKCMWFEDVQVGGSEAGQLPLSKDTRRRQC